MFFAPHISAYDLGAKPTSCRPGRGATIFPSPWGEAGMSRRDSLLLLGGGTAWCFAAAWAFAQQAAKVPRVGVLVSASEPHPFAEALRRGFQRLGYAEGRNIILDVRYNFPILYEQAATFVDKILKGENP